MKIFATFPNVVETSDSFSEFASVLCVMDDTLF